MSLASKFPRRSETDFKACDDDREIAYDHESIGSIVQDEVQNEVSPSGGSNTNKLFDVNGICASVCSPNSQNPYDDIPLIPSNLVLESREIHAEFTNTKIMDEGDISKNLGCMESFGSEAIVQQKTTARAQETTDLCASSSASQVLPQCSSQVEANQAKDQCSSKNDIAKSEVIFQNRTPSRKKRSKVDKKQENTIDWNDLRTTYAGGKAVETSNTMDSLAWEGVRQVTFDVVADAIKERGQHCILAERIKDFLDRLVRDHGRIDLDWLRAVPPDKAKEYLLSYKDWG